MMFQNIMHWLIWLCIFNCIYIHITVNNTFSLVLMSFRPKCCVWLQLKEHREKMPWARSCNSLLSIIISNSSSNSF